MLDTPVVLVGFARPDLTARNLEILRAVRPATLLVVCDGPRPDRPGEDARTAEVRRVLDGIDWPADVRHRYADVNRGCEATVELGLDWVFGQVDRAIVLEDDCLADPSFFRFAGDLLDRYANDPRVWHVAGNSLQVPAELFGGRSYAFSTWASVWGWATWADRWQRHRAVFPRDHAPAPGGGRSDAPVRTVPARPTAGSLVTRGAVAHFKQAAASQDVHTHGWDKHWWLTIMTEGGLSITPAVNLVENVGFGPDATHGVGERRPEPAQAATFPLCHPDRVALDVEVERELELVLARVGGRAARVARKLITHPALRRRARALADSRAVASASRAVSRRLNQGRP